STCGNRPARIDNSPVPPKKCKHFVTSYRFGESMSSWNHSRISTALSWLLVGILGAVEGLYGRTQYLGDWLCYLNVSRAVSSLDWKGIFDPMWNAGYPILV